MSSWNSALKAFLLRSARSTHSFPRTLRRVFIPFWDAFRLIATRLSRSGKVRGQRGEKLLDGGLRRLAVRVAGLAIFREGGLHARCIHHQRARDRPEEVEAGAERRGDLRNQRHFGLPSAQGALMLGDPR